MYSIVTNGMSPVSSTDEIFLYIDDFSITELPTGENSALHVTFSNGTDSRTAGACEQGYISGGADAYTVLDNTKIVIGRANYASLSDSGARRTYLKFLNNSTAELKTVRFTFMLTR